MNDKQDVASEPVEAALSGAGVFKGASGLTGLRDAQAFWDQQPYGTRLYYDDYNYLHRGVLSAACDLIAENAALKAKLKAADHLIVTLTDNSARFEAERDEARAEAERRLRLIQQYEEELSKAKAEAQKLREEVARLKDTACLPNCEDREDPATAGQWRRVHALNCPWPNRERLEKLREERDAAVAAILEEYESWGADCSDDFVCMAKEILRRREEKGGE